MQNQELPEDTETPFFEETESALLRTLHALLTERLVNQGALESLRKENGRLRLQLSDKRTQDHIHRQEEIDPALEPRLDPPTLIASLRYALSVIGSGGLSAQSVAEKLGPILLRQFLILKRPLRGE